jgi:septal ring factor EnvC (AmiA/AmiB activator)
MLARVALSGAVKARFRWAWVCLTMALLAVVAGEPTALAQAAPNCDQLQAQIAELEQRPGTATVAKQQLNAAARAVTRARDARAAGDVEHGLQLEALAADYVSIARTVMRAAALEAQLRNLQTRQTELETAIRHTETLLEATIAQRERTKAVLQQALAAQRTGQTVLRTETSKTRQGAKK